MKRDPESGVLLASGAVPFTDGSEGELFRVVQAARDRSSLSDELAGAICDWPTRYHLSRMRANLIRPFSLGPQVRVLEVGAGTGAVSRYLGETGARVIALEGNLDRARVAQARCEEQRNVVVVRGTLDDFDDEDGFDLVVVVGVLEYAASAQGGAGGPQAFLARLRRLLRPAGALALAIENQLGLKYLLGYPEDHLGEPWLGVAGYPDPSGIHTYSRGRLGEMLRDAGFPEQEWLYPFPDYKLPRVIVRSSAYRLANPETTVDRIVAAPVLDYAYEATLRCDERRAHRVFLQAGLGEDVANSFLVLASEGRESPTRFLPKEVLAWDFGDERLRCWSGWRELRESEGSLWLHSCGSGEEPGSWLAPVDGSQQWPPGPSLEQEFKDADATGNRDEATRILRTWFDRVGSLRKVSSGADSHPFAATAGSALPGEWLEAGPDRLVHAGTEAVDGDLPRWRVVGEVDADLVLFRAIWRLAEEGVRGGPSHGEDPGPDVDTRAREWSSIVGLDGDGLLPRWRQAEAALEEAITGRPAEWVLENLHRRGRQRAEGLPGLPVGRIGRLGEGQASEMRRWAEEVERLRGEVAGLREDATRWRAFASRRTVRAYRALRSWLRRTGRA